MNESMEMYLETVLILERNHGHAHSVDIAKRLGVSKPSVTKAMRLLKTKGFVDKETYGPITLTSKGKAFSEKIFGTHKLITSFLVHSLKLTEEKAAENACKMEHIVTSEMIYAIKNYLSDNGIRITDNTLEV
jgi:Mn-dependent DtxR family transcriptional regulator